MAHDARGAIDALRRSHDEMVGMAEGTGPDALARGSGCAEWTVAKVLSHLGSAAEIGLATLEVGRSDGDLAQGVWDRWNAMAPEEQAASFVTADERYVAAYEALDDGALATKRFDLGFLPEPVTVQFLASMRLSEVGQHRWDIEVGSDPAATVPAYVVPYTLDVLQGFAAFFAKPSGQTGQVAVRTTDPAGSYLLTLTESGASLAEDGADAPTHLRLPGEAFVRLLGGRLGARHTPAAVTIDGELTLDDLRRFFPGY